MAYKPKVLTVTDGGTGVATLTGIPLASGTSAFTALTRTASTTWTPTLVGGSVAGTTTYTAQNGYYLQVDNLVWLFGHIALSAATGTGNAQIGGIPVACANTTNGNYTGTCFINAVGWAWPLAATMMAPTFVPAGGSTLVLEGSGSVKASQVMQMTNAAFEIWFTMVYAAA